MTVFGSLWKLNFSFLRQRESVLDIHAKVSNYAFDLSVAEKDLNRA